MTKSKDLPDGWTIKPMPEVVTWGSGGTPKATQSAYYSGGKIPWLIIGDLNDRIVTESQSKITKLGLKNSNAKMIPPGTLMVAMYGSIGKLGITGIECCTNQAIAFAKELRGVTTKYMFYYLTIMKSKLISMGKGGTQKNISLTVLKSIDVIVPPINVQAKIVFQIEELTSALDKSVETLRTIKKQLAVYRQAVLKEAFETCIKKGVQEKNIDGICDVIVDCPHSTPKWTSSGKLCLRTTNFRRGYLDLTEPNYVSQDTFDDRTTRLRPKPGDVLYSREGAILGLACIIPDRLEVCLGQRMMLLRTCSSVNSRFLMHYLNSPYLSSVISENIGGSASPHINVGDIKKFNIPIPNIRIQDVIVQMIESRLSVCDSIEQTVNTALAQANAMRQSILKQAFEGGLTQ
ncbi:MAG TPA: restriction endonuclease subunit S [Caproicibacter sp.]|nr:restriction endonuclease subunit S [Caproicibacter sp.]